MIEDMFINERGVRNFKLEDVNGLSFRLVQGCSGLASDSTSEPETAR